MKKGFSLVELMVGLVVALILVGMMAVFMGDVSYVFQDHKMTVRARGQLQRSLLMLSREMMEIGVEPGGSSLQGLIEHDGIEEWFFDIYYDGNGQPVMTFLSTPETIDTLASQDKVMTDSIEWTRTTYDIRQVNHPVIPNKQVNALFKTSYPATEEPPTPIPFIFNVSSISVELGIDSDGNGDVDEDEWTTDYPVSEADKFAIYPSLKELRITITTETQQASKKNAQGPVESTLSQEIFLRNRRDQ